VREEYLVKINNLSKYHGAGPNSAASVLGRPCPQHKHEGPQWKTFWRHFCPGPQTWGTFGGS